MDQTTVDDWQTLLTGFHLITMDEEGDGYGLVRDGALAIADGKIAWLGSAEQVPAGGAYERIEGGGNFLTPGLIDCHTHVVFGGARADEWERRLGGVSYEEIARAGGGILSTVRATRAASEEQLFQAASKRVQRFLEYGVTTVEIKSGYGLDLESERKMLQVATRIGQELPVSVSRTMLGAHAIPPEFSGRGDQYISMVCQQMVPMAAEWAEAVDVFCETIAFDLSQTERVFAAAGEHGLAVKIHAEQLSCQGAAAMASERGAWSADHLEYLDEAGVDAMQQNGTVATLLPGAYYFLQETQKPPVKLLRKKKVPIAIATDCNPGSSPVMSLPLMMNFACTFFDMTPVEALAGVTCHAAKALRMQDSIGRLRVGMQADLAAWDIQSPAELAYGIGHDPCRMVFKAGKQVVSR